jgi:hypothetical protein
MWNLSRPGLAPPSRSNPISNSISARPIRTPQIVHSASTPGPPHTRSGRRLGSLPVSMTFDTTPRIVSSSMLAGLRYAQPRTVYGAAERGDKAKCQGVRRPPRQYLGPCGRREHPSTEVTAAVSVGLCDQGASGAPTRKWWCGGRDLDCRASSPSPASRSAPS